METLRDIWWADEFTLLKEQRRSRIVDCDTDKYNDLSSRYYKDKSINTPEYIARLIHLNDTTDGSLILN